MQIRTFDKNFSDMDKILSISKKSAVDVSFFSANARYDFEVECVSKLILW